MLLCFVLQASEVLPGNICKDRPDNGTRRPGGDTVYFCVVDGDGDGCSFINSNYEGFGSGMLFIALPFTLHVQKVCYASYSHYLLPCQLRPGKAYKRHAVSVLERRSSECHSSIASIKGSVPCRDSARWLWLHSSKSRAQLHPGS